MITKLALLVGFLFTYSTQVVEGRFEKNDKLDEAPANLQYAFITFRHGIRSPTDNLYKTDKEFLKKWPGGKGSLTEDGKKLMVHVGRSLKKRYNRVVPDYNADQVSFTSTLSPRATVSSYLVAAGMFKPPKPIIAELPGWQPVPIIHSATYDKKDLFDEDKINSMCPRYSKIKELIISEEWKKLESQDSVRQEIEEINSKLQSSQSPVKTIKSSDDLYNVWDIYFMEKLNEQTSEPWTNDLLPSMTKLSQFRLWSRMHGKIDGQHSILQYYTGPILNHILQGINKQNSKCSESPGQKCRTRLHLHGSHDLTVGSLVWALADNQEEFMAYPGDALILEAYQGGIVKLFLYSPMKTEGKKLVELSMNGLCNGTPCQYDQLKAGLDNRGLAFTEDVWKQKCNDMNDAEKTEWRKLPKL